MRKTNANWPAIRAAYIRGEGTLRELAAKNGIKPSTITQRASREKWSKDAKDVCAQVVKCAVDSIRVQGEAWQRETFSRMKEYRSHIGETLSNLIKVPRDDRPLHLDQLTKAEFRVDDMGRRALGLVDPRHVDITSGGLPLGAFGDALAEVRRMIEAGSASVKTVDIDSVAGVPLSNDTEGV